MDCFSTRLVLQLRPPAGGEEFAPEDVAALDRHLADCPACAAFARRLGAWDERIGAAVNDVPVPDRLGPMLFARFDRSRRREAIRRWAWRGAAAAGLLLAAGGGYGGYVLSRPTLDAETVAWRHDRDDEFVEAVFDDWRRDEGLPPLPADFDFRHHVFHGRERLFGEQVPVVVFHRREVGGVRGDRAKLKVYWVRRSAFRLDQFRDAQTSRHTARALGGSADGRWLFVAVYDTADLGPFLRREPPLVG